MLKFVNRKAKDMNQKNNKLKAFTLTEMLVVLVIIGILVMIALPKLMSTVSDAHSPEAQLHLKDIKGKQQIYFYKNSKYTDDLKAIGYEAPLSVEEGGQAYYSYSIKSASNTSFVAEARAVRDFDQDGNFNVWEIDQNGKMTEVTPD